MATSDSPLNVPDVTLAVARSASAPDPDPGGVDITLPEANLMVDTFETGNMTPTLNNVGFSWGANNKTSIVTMDPNPVAIWNNGSINNYSSDLSTDWTAKEGSNSLRFRWNAGEDNAEQRWSMTSPQPDLWKRFWLRTVDGWYYPDNGNNCKFHALWTDGYEFGGTGSTIIYALRPNGKAGGAQLVCAVTGPEDGGTVLQSPEDPVFNDFIDAVRDAGRWQQIVMRVKASSSFGANDGLIQSWRRWEDEDAFTLMQNQTQEYTGIPPGETGYRAGFVLGYMNQPGYAQATEMLIDKYELSDSPLVPAGTEGL